jgi:hypothetical protein
LALDPTVDSIAGTSLYNAYELLKGRISTPVIVAVIDNGVNIEHRDLKSIIRTNGGIINAYNAVKLAIKMTEGK